MNDEFGDKLRIEAEKVVKLLIDKNEAYSFSFAEFGDAGMLIHVSDKVTRLKNLIDKKDGDVKFESMEDSIVDLLGYSLLWLYMRHYMNKENE